MRLALAAAVLAFAMPAHAAPHATPHAKPRPAAKPRGPVVTLRTQIVAGDHQTAHAYAATSEPKYVTTFPVVLVVHVVGWPREGGKRRVHFHCETKGCVLAKADQPNDGKDIDDRPDSEPATYKVHVVKGVASLKIAVESDRPAGVYVVTATPGVTHGERAIPATFTLISN